jgi:uncharacterized protein YutE (UPF0331/DUF86 family)
MSEATEDQGLLDAVVARLQAEGFEVYVNPPEKDVPAFLRGIASPDAIGRRPDKKIIVEISRDTPAARERYKKMLDLVLPHGKEWELRVYWANPSSAPKPVERVSKQEIERTIRSVEDLIAHENTSAALLMGWAAFEALGRALMPEKFRRPQTPGRLIEELASTHLTPDEADQLRHLAKMRNALIHGGLQTKVDKQELKNFLDVLKTLADLLVAA